jgi:hypothetical protein
MSRHSLVPLVTIAALAALPPAAPAQIGSSPVQFLEQSTPGISLPEQDDAFLGGALAAGDFDGDGFEDLAIGIPGYDLDGTENVGLVLTMYGSWDGPATAAHDLWTQNNVLLLDAGEEDDHFGQSLAAGDFDDDGYDDLAIGIPYETVGGIASAGAVQILYGSATGLSTTDQFFHQGFGGGLILGNAEVNDRFGFTLAVGDFDADGHDDLVVGVPYETISDKVGAGAFHLLFGSDSGLSTTGDRLFYLSNGLPRLPGAGDNLAWSLAAGDFDPGSPGDELAVGAPGSSAGGHPGAGAVWIVSNLDGTTTAFPLDLDDAGMPDDAASGDQFGCALTAGQFDGVGAVDLAIGACRKPVGVAGDAGKVYAYYGDARPAVAIDQNGLPGEQAEASDFFGLVLASGDFDADGVDDLVVGVHFEDVDGAESAGVAHILPGVHDAGLTKTGASSLHQVGDAAEYDDRFGQAIVTGHFSGHSGSDLAIGAPNETFSPNEWAGAVNVFFSRTLFVDDFESGDMVEWSAVAGAF